MVGFVPSFPYPIVLSKEGRGGDRRKGCSESETAFKSLGVLQFYY